MLLSGRSTPFQEEEIAYPTGTMSQSALAALAMTCFTKYFHRSFGCIHFVFAAVVCVGSRSTPLFDT